MLEKNNFKFIRSKLSLAIGTAIMLTTSNAVFAQENESEKEHNGIEKIIVTAQKRVQSIQEVPVSITAFSGETIEKMGLNTSSDLAEKTPNLTIGQPTGEGGVVAIVMRGVGLSDFAPNNQAPIGLYVDGVVAGNSNAQITTMFDVDRVEVLRGPQGTLYGRNTTGGAINVISNKPWDETEGKIKLSMGSYGMQKIEGMINLSLTDNLFTRLSVVDYNLDGYMKNTATNNKIAKSNTAFRWLTQWQVNDEWSVLFNIHGNDNDSDADLYSASDAIDFYEGPSEFDPKISTKTFGGSITVDGEITDKITLTSITAFDELEKHQQEDSDLLPLDFITAEYNPETESFTQELRLNGQYEKGHWILGLFYGQDKIDYHQSSRLYGDAEYIFETDFDGNGQLEPYSVNQLPGFFWNFNNKQELKSAAIFGQIDHKLQDNLELSIGLRYSQEEVNLASDADLTGIGLVLPPEVGGFGLPIELVPELFLPGYYAAVGTNPDVDENGHYYNEIDDSNVSGKIGLNWNTSDDVMLFASYSRGFKGGGLNGNFIFNPDALSEFGAETVNSFEVGIKSDLLNNDLRFNASAFVYDYQDAQIFNNSPDPSFGLPAQRVINADTSIVGFEAEINWLATDALSIQASLGYVDSEYDESPVDPVLGTLEIKGNQLQNAPKYSASIIANYYWETEVGEVNAMFDMSYNDKTYFSPLEDDAVAMDSYVISNARLTWNSNDETWGIAAWVKNIADKEVRTYAYDLRNDFGFLEYMRGAPRMVGIDISYHF